MKKLLPFLLFALFIFASTVSCGCSEEIVSVTGKDYRPDTTSVCTKVGNTYIPSHGGVCFGVIERIPEKHIVYYSNGYSRSVSKSTFDSLEVGLEVIICR